MIALFLAFLACASAAPQYYHHHHHGPPPFHHNHRHEDFTVPDYFEDNVFDTGRFWAELSTEMKKFDDMLKDFYVHFPTTAATEGIEGNQYIINIPLNGYEEKEIVVKAHKELLMVQAVHKIADNSQRSYLDLRTLPANVNPDGIWAYENGILKISFPLSTESSTVPAVTQAVEKHSREEIEPYDNKVNSSEDVELDVRDDLDTNKQTELMTNEIPQRNSVEATTYAVDLKGEVEFVPVSY